MCPYSNLYYIGTCQLTLYLIFKHFRSLRICLRIFGYYAPQIREHSVKWYAQNLLPCMRVISRRKETLLQETLSDFVAKFGKHIQQGLTDSETCKLFEVN